MLLYRLLGSNLKSWYLFISPTSICHSDPDLKYGGVQCNEDHNTSLAAHVFLQQRRTASENDDTSSIKGNGT